MRRRDEYFCQVANETARKSAMNHKHGCVIVYKDKEIVAHGVNHDVCTMNDIKSIHAEVSAINQLRKLMRTNKEKNYIQNCKLYVVRVGSPNMNFPLKNSKPCLHCEQSIYKIGIPIVYYSTDDEFYTAFNTYSQPPQVKHSSPSHCHGRPLSSPPLPTVSVSASQGRPQPTLSPGRPITPHILHPTKGRPRSAPQLPSPGRPQPTLSQGRPLSAPQPTLSQGRPITPPILPTCSIS